MVSGSTDKEKMKIRRCKMNKRCFEYYCDNLENVENYEKAEKDNFKGWHCHHRLETHNSDGERRLVNITRKELVALGVYWHRPASELIFLTTLEHNRLHHRGKIFSEESKRRMSEARKGTTFSEEHKAKISAANKGHSVSEEAKKKISVALKGRTAWNKGKTFSEEHKRKISAARKGKPSPNKGKTMSEEQKAKISAAMKGKRKGKPSGRKGKHWKLVDGKRVWY